MGAPLSTQQAGFVIVTQSRKVLPDPIGGVTWFTPGEASTSCFTPLYCAIGALPEAYTRGDYKKFSWDSAWWVANLVSNLAYDRWSRIFPDVQQVQTEQERALLKMQPVIEETAAKLASTDPALMNSFLTNYSVSTGDAVFHRWQELASAILSKHVDGYMKDPKGSPKAPGYAQGWLREVIKCRPGQFKLPESHQPVETDHRRCRCLHV